MFTLRRNLAIGLLMIASIWPIVHAAISAALEWSGWKGGGWAMYSVPPKLVKGEAVSDPDGRSLDTTDLRKADRDAVLAAWDHFSNWRIEFGPMITPEVFARELFLRYPGVSEIQIIVRVYSINRKSAMTELESTIEYPYQRDQFEK